MSRSPGAGVFWVSRVVIACNIEGVRIDASSPGRDCGMIHQANNIDGDVQTNELCL